MPAPDSCSCRSSPCWSSSRSRRWRRCASGGSREMMLGMRGLVLASCLILSVQQAPFDPESGISDTLAHDRAARVSNLRYDLAFTIPVTRAEPISGRALIRFALASADAPFILDYQPDKAGFVHRVDANGRETAVRQVNGHIIVPAAA